MISKNKIKLIRSLDTKKGREKAHLFVAEGPKIVNDLLAAGYMAEDVFDDMEDIKKVSFLQHPQQKLATFRLKNNEETTLQDVMSGFEQDKLSLALDGIQDPGNLGTIIRLADWFGIEHIYCSKETVDCWSPKVVQATMGSIARVRLHYLNLYEFIDALPKGYPIYATLLDGKNIYEQELTPNGIIVMGNEGKGITQELRNKINTKLLIPSFPKNRETADSLNVAIATSIVCAEFRRRRGF